MKSLEKYARRLAADSSRVFVRRVMWPDMEARVRKVFQSIQSSSYKDQFGGLYIHNGTHEVSKHYHRTQILNQLQISCGSRLLGLSALEVEDGKIKHKTRFETHAALWFSQAPAGSVTVFMSPYKSDVSSMNEENIALGMYKDPVQLTEREIHKILSRFFKYLSITSALHQHTFLDYAWRLWLIYLDARSKKLGTALKGLERMIIFGGALVTVWAFVALTNKT